MERSCTHKCGEAFSEMCGLDGGKTFDEQGWGRRRKSGWRFVYERLNLGTAQSGDASVAVCGARISFTAALLLAELRSHTSTLSLLRLLGTDEFQGHQMSGDDDGAELICKQIVNCWTLASRAAWANVQFWFG